MIHYCRKNLFFLPFLFGILILYSHGVLSLSSSDDGGRKVNNANNNNNRRSLLRNTFVGALATTTVMTNAPYFYTNSAAVAATTTTTTRSPNGYKVQYTEREWAYVLSGSQYNVLRQGGTERQKSSILNTNTVGGTYVCAGCNTPLFVSAAKFSSGTGWPSFATADDSAIEVENLNIVQSTLNGREVRCGTCGGHLGDVFSDGWIYVGTVAAKSGLRYCINGAALIFKPSDGSEEVMGDLRPANKAISYESSTYRSPQQKK